MVDEITNRNAVQDKEIAYTVPHTQYQVLKLFFQ